METPNHVLQDRFEQAVEIAAGRAAQRVAGIHRRRLVRWTFLAAMLTTLCVVLGLYFAFIAPSQRSFVRKHTTFNCQLVGSLSSTMADFVQTDITLRQQQLALSKRSEVVQAENKLFGKSELAKLEKESNKFDQTAIARWSKHDIPALNKLAGTDCVARLGG